jgi:hypothetical protein
MIVQSACQASIHVLATENLSRPNCPRCGSILLIAEESRFNAQGSIEQGRIDHDWSCDDCAHKFVTSVRLRRS